LFASNWYWQGSNIPIGPCLVNQEQKKKIIRFSRKTKKQKTPNRKEKKIERHWET